MPPVRPLAPLPTRSASSKSTLFFGASLANHAAADNPENPPPTTAKSTCSGSGARLLRKVIFQGVAPQCCFLSVIAFLRCRGSLPGSYFPISARVFLTLTAGWRVGGYSEAVQRRSYSAAPRGRKYFVPLT